MLLFSYALTLTAVSLIVCVLLSYVIGQTVEGEILRIFNPSNSGQANPPNATQSTGNDVNPPSNFSSTTSGSADEKPALFIELLTGSNPGFRGADQSIYVNVLDYSSRTGIAQAKIDGVMVGGLSAADFIKNANTTTLLDMGQIDGQTFSGVTDNNGQFSHVTRIDDDFELGPIALLVTVKADGYESSSKIATFKLE